MPLQQFSSSLPPEVLNIYIRKLAVYHALSAGLEKSIQEKCFEIRLKKGNYLFKKGEYCHFFCFIVSGSLVGSNVIKNKTFTTFLSFAGEFVTSVSGMYGESPSEESVVAAEDTLLLALSAEDLLSWYETFPETNIIMRKILEASLKCAHLRENLSRLQTASDKYSYFLEHLNRRRNDAPIEATASFLGIKVQTFTKMQKESCFNANQNGLYEQIESIEYHMTVKQIFKEKGLTVSKLAEYLNIKPHRLSFLLNFHYKLNFSEFIKQHRVTYVKSKLMRYQNWHHLTVDGVGFDAGFSSRSAFFAAFKKTTGVTPAEFAAMMESSYTVKKK